MLQLLKDAGIALLFVSIIAAGLFVGFRLIVRWGLPNVDKLMDKMRMTFKEFQETAQAVVHADGTRNTRVRVIADWNDYLFALANDRNDNRDLAKRINDADTAVDFVNSLPEIKGKGKFKTVIPEMGDLIIRFVYEPKL